MKKFNFFLIALTIAILTEIWRFIFIGEDQLKLKKISEIKSKFLSPANKDFNYDLIYAKELKKEKLRKTNGYS